MNSLPNQMITFEIREMVWLELDYAVGAFALDRNRRYLTDEQIKIYRKIPREWYELARQVLPESEDYLVIFEMLGMLCPKEMMSESYPHIRAYLQQIDDAKWQERLKQAGARSIAEYLMLLVKSHHEGVDESFIHLPRVYLIMEHTAKQIEKIFTHPNINHSFWKCMDTFVEDYYLPWRNHNMGNITKNRSFFVKLQTQEGGCTMDELLGALPKTNALHYRSHLRQHVLSGRLSLLIWLEPIGLFDSWTIFHKNLVISVSRPERLFQIAKEEIEEIAERCKALSDPTRLGILRVIRHFDMDITELADYFGLSRPTVSVHIKKLREAGLVDSFEDGRSTRHVLNAGNVKGLLEEIEHFLEME